MTIFDPTTPPDLLLPMYQRRPEWLNQEIEMARAEFTSGIENVYFNRGTAFEYRMGSGVISDYSGAISTSELVDEMERSKGRKLDILDIGAGAGKFVTSHLTSGHNAQGVSIQDYRRFNWVDDVSKALPDNVYLVGDANNLAEIEGLNPEADLIVARHVLEHLVDPLSVIEQAIGMLRPGGVFLSNIVPRKYMTYAPYGSQDILDRLSELGFDGSQSYHHLDSSKFSFYSMVVRASADIQPVRLGIGYRQELGSG